MTLEEIHHAQAQVRYLRDILAREGLSDEDAQKLIDAVGSLAKHDLLSELEKKIQERITDLDNKARDHKDRVVCVDPDHCKVLADIESKKDESESFLELFAKEGKLGQSS